MKMKQRKVCGNCRCYSPVNKDCALGYQTKYIMKFGIVMDAQPLEPCPKPLTVNDSNTAYQFYRKNNF